MLNVGNPLAYGLDTVMDLQGRLRDVERVGPSTRRSLSSWHARLFLKRLCLLATKSYRSCCAQSSEEGQEPEQERRGARRGLLMEGSVGWRSMKSIVSSATDTPHAEPEVDKHFLVYICTAVPDRRTIAKGSDGGHSQLPGGTGGAWSAASRPAAPLSISKCCASCATNQASVRSTLTNGFCTRTWNSSP